MRRSEVVNPYESPQTCSDYEWTWLPRFELLPPDAPTPRPEEGERVFVIAVMPGLMAGYVTALVISNCLRIAGVLTPGHPWSGWASRLVYPVSTLERMMSDPLLVYTNLLAGAAVWGLVWIVGIAIFYRPRPARRRRRKSSQYFNP